MGYFCRIVLVLIAPVVGVKIDSWRKCRVQKPIDPPSMVQAELQLNRLLFERNGTSFVLALADYIVAEDLQVSESALNALNTAVRSVRREA